MRGRLLKNVFTLSLACWIIFSVLVNIAEADTVLRWTNTNGFFLTKFKTESSNRIYYQGLYIYSATQMFDVSGCYFTATKTLELVVKHFGSGMITFTLKRISATDFTGTWWQAVKDNEGYTYGHNIRLSVVTTSPGDFPDWQGGGGIGNGP